MTTDIDDRPPTLGTCEYCTWEFNFPTVPAKDKGEAVHLERWHAEQAPPTEELCEALIQAHPDDFEVVVAAFRSAAAHNGGEVDQNFVRAILPPGLNPRVVSATYRVMRGEAKKGRPGLVKDGTNISDDTRGRNAGRLQPLYRWVGE